MEKIKTTALEKTKGEEESRLCDKVSICSFSKAGNKRLAVWPVENCINKKN